MKDRTIIISGTFYEDHLDRMGRAPVALAWNKRRVTIAANDPLVDALLEDARHYCDPYGPASEPDQAWLRNAARRTIAAIEKARS